jgi:DNA modification methylase
MSDSKRISVPATDRLKEDSRARTKKTGEGRPRPNPLGRGRNCLTPALTLVERAPQALKRAPRRVRRSLKKHVKEVEDSLRAFGICDPILITGDDQIVDGQVTVEAALQLGLESIPCVVINHLAPDEIRALRLALNRLQEKGTWDLDALRLEFQDLLEIDVSLEITGFEVSEIDLVLVGEGGQSGEAEPDAEANTIPDVGASNTEVSREGDVWELGLHRVACGDARDPATYEALLGEEQATAVITDPPYNVQIDGHATGKGAIRHREFVMASGEMTPEAFTAFLHLFLTIAARYTVDGGLVYVWMDWRHLDELLDAAKTAGLGLLNLCVWVKNNAGMGSFYRSQHELVLVLKKGKGPHLNNVQLGRFGRNRTNVWRYPGVNTLDPERRAELEMHPTVKPCEMVADAILDCTRRKDLVLDPFLGSGTTVIAAEKTGRRCRGIELDPRYVDVAIRRWQAFTETDAIHARSGLTFDQLAAIRLSDVPLLPPPAPADETEVEV